jgi:hypothetical protein
MRSARQDLLLTIKLYHSREQMASVFRISYLSDRRIRKFAKACVDRLAPYIKILLVKLSREAPHLEIWSEVLEKLNPASIMFSSPYVYWNAPPTVIRAYQRELAALFKAAGTHCKGTSVALGMDATLRGDYRRPSTFSDRGLLRLIAEQVQISCMCLAFWPFCWQLELGSPGYADLTSLTLRNCHLYTDRSLANTLQVPCKIQSLDIMNPTFGSGRPVRDLLRYVAPSLVKLKIELSTEDCGGWPLHGLFLPKLKHLQYKREYMHPRIGIPVAPKLVSLEVGARLIYPFKDREIDDMRYLLSLYCQYTSLKTFSISLTETWGGMQDHDIYFDNLEDFGARQLEIVVTECHLSSYRYINAWLLSRTKSLWIDAYRSTRDGETEVWTGTEMMACPLLEKVVIIGLDAESLLSKLVAPRLTKVSIYKDEFPMFAGR